MAIRQGLFRCFRDGSGPTARVYANDCDEDVCTAWFLLNNAHLAEQFEVVQRWMAGANASGGYSAQSDPLLGVVDPSTPRRLYPFEHAGKALEIDLGPEPFVTLQWGAYFFVPSIPALKALPGLVELPLPLPAATPVPLQAPALDDFAGWQRWLNAQLGHADWFNGASFGWADLSVVPYLNCSAAFDLAPPAGSPLAAWLARVNAHPSVASTAAEADTGCEGENNRKSGPEGGLETKGNTREHGCGRTSLGRLSNFVDRSAHRRREVLGDAAGHLGQQRLCGGGLGAGPFAREHQHVAVHDVGRARAQAGGAAVVAPGLLAGRHSDVDHETDRPEQARRDHTDRAPRSRMHVSARQTREPNGPTVVRRHLRVSRVCVVVTPPPARAATTAPVALTRLRRGAGSAFCIGCADRVDL